MHVVDNTNHHMVPDEKFRAMIVKRPHREPQPMTLKSYSKNIHCKTVMLTGE